VMRDAGYAHMGMGVASGRDKAEVAAQEAISSPLIETNMNGAKGVIMSITGSADIGLEEVELAASIIQKAAHADATIIFGAALDDTLTDEIKVTVIATGGQTNEFKREKEESLIPGYDADLLDDTDATSEDSSDDDDYIDIMTIFNRNK